MPRAFTTIWIKHRIVFIFVNAAATKPSTNGFLPLAEHLEEFVSKGSSAEDVEEEVDGVIEQEKWPRCHVILRDGNGKREANRKLVQVTTFDCSFVSKRDGQSSFD